MSSRRINDPGIIASCHCGAEYEKDYSASIETHTTTSIDSGLHKSTDTPHEELVNSRPDDWENDYYNPIMAVNDAPPETPLRPEIQAQVDQIHFLQKPVERELVSAESVKQTDAQRSTERFKNESIGRIAHRTTSILRHRSTLTSQYRSTDSQNSAEEPLIPTVPGNSTRWKKMSMTSIEMNKDTPEI